MLVSNWAVLFWVLACEMKIMFILFICVRINYLNLYFLRVHKLINQAVGGRLIFLANNFHELGCSASWYMACRSAQYSAGSAQKPCRLCIFNLQSSRSGEQTVLVLWAISLGIVIFTSSFLPLTLLLIFHCGYSSIHLIWQLQVEKVREKEKEVCE